MAYIYVNYNVIEDLCVETTEDIHPTFVIAILRTSELSHQISGENG